MFVEAIILKKVAYLENHLIISCLTRQKGLIQAIAYNAKSITKKKTPIIDLFRHLTFEISQAKKNSLYTIKSTELISNFDTIAKIYPQYQSCCFISQFMIKNLVEQDEKCQLFDLLCFLLKSYQKKANTKLWETCFFIHFLIEYGYFHPEEENKKNSNFVEKVLKIKEKYLELEQINDKVWTKMHQWSLQRCLFHELNMPKNDFT